MGMLQIIKRQIIVPHKKRSIRLLRESNQNFCIVKNEDLGDIFELTKKQLDILAKAKIKMRIIRPIFKKEKKWGTVRTHYVNNTGNTFERRDFSGNRFGGYVGGANYQGYDEAYGIC